MAQTPDISAILAALAAQPPAPTPSNAPPPVAAPAPAPIQNGQPPMPAGYPGVVSAATPANPLAGLALPQPTSTGSLDLSNIKPTNTGNVSLADAIAKARTNVGVRPERYSQRRSRSRSPRREGNQPEGYNPFRDERRSEVRRASPGRGRSATPPRGAYAGASFPLGAAPETAGESTEVIVVEKSSVGLIIGRNGENLKRVEAEFGARVQFMADTGETTRKCKITGTPQQRADAITDIFRTAQENPKRNQQAQAVNSNGDPPLREGERSVQIMVPDKTVGLIIGRRGETIQDLQERSGCHINILGENKSERGLRPVNLIGTYEASEKAKQLIMEVVESDTRLGQQGLPQIPPVSHSPYGPPPTGYNPYGGPPMPQYGQPPAPAYGQPPPDQKTEEKIFVPSEAVGMIIGKGGETIKAMQASHGCKINVSQPQGSDVTREIGLIGTTSAKEGAKRDIWDKVNTVREKQGGLRADTLAPAQADPYAHHRAPPSYGYPPAAAMAPVHAPPPVDDPYAAYGGYANYVALWQQSVAYQQAGSAPPQ